MTNTTTSTGDEASQLCRLAFDLNSAALALAAEAAEMACGGLPVNGHDRRLRQMSCALADLASDLDGCGPARPSAAWACDVGGVPAVIPAE